MWDTKMLGVLQILPNERLTVSQRRGKVAADDVTEVEVSLCCSLPGPFTSEMEVEVRGGKALKLKIKADAVVPIVATQVDPAARIGLIDFMC
jgi:hypothetical protein